MSTDGLDVWLSGDADTVMTVVDGSATNVKSAPSAVSSNPSSRRHGLANQFWCEGCQGVTELTVEQHKGHTYLAWRPAAEPPKMTKEYRQKKQAPRC